MLSSDWINPNIILCQWETLGYDFNSLKTTKKILTSKKKKLNISKIRSAENCHDMAEDGEKAF